MTEAGPMPVGPTSTVEEWHRSAVAWAYENVRNYHDLDVRHDLRGLMRLFRVSPWDRDYSGMPTSWIEHISDVTLVAQKVFWELLYHDRDVLDLFGASRG